MPRGGEATARLAAFLEASGIGDLAVSPPEGAPLLRWPAQAPLGSGGRPPPPGSRGELWLSERPPDSEGIEALARGAALAGCAALGLPPPADASLAVAEEEACERAGIALVRLRSGLSLPGAAGRLAHALARELAGERSRGREPAGGGTEAPGGAEALVRVASLAYLGKDGELAARSTGGDTAAELAASLPRGVALRALLGHDRARFLAALSYAPGLDRQVRTGLKAFASSTGAVVGLSDLARGAPGPDALERLSDNAGRALELGAALFGPGRLASYDNVALYLAYIDDGRDEPLLALSARTLERIKAHDDETGEGLYRTIEAYFRNGRNARRTAAELGIQRKTLKKRLAHVEALTDYPVDAEGRLGYELALAMRYWTRGRVSR